jgi:hypothetical protein
MKTGPVTDAQQLKQYSTHVFVADVTLIKQADL